VERGALLSREGDVYQIDKADMHGVWEVSNIIEPQTCVIVCVGGWGWGLFGWVGGGAPCL